MALNLFWLDPNDTESPFPDVRYALRQPEGLLAVGGDLSPRRLIRAYRHGVFPWYSEGQPLLWWSPDPRAVLFPDRLRVSRSLRKTLRKGTYRVTLDQAFEAVITRCAEPRPGQDGTWITREMRDAYCALHRSGVVHSAEAWCDGELVGGLYGVALGRVFFGESMFSRRPDASKVAFYFLVQQLRAWDYAVIDGQVPSQHLYSLGAEDLERGRFIELLHHWCAIPGQPPPWHLDPGIGLQGQA
ncbi:MAG: leucyl/phenylalanyl-tRNA--protein transferase [Chromatiales bacterium 21-64-14]|nr:MAG: leucyl/phenylalanyl-tRNA--protein transferase [Chromatiales bacterium 21-64-14]HQU16414.1 leucyl/phenylalanyl-tRNA--protein transferase [Gammaproteobacteria bacterium]